ncbi:SpoIIE family protein phosphatase [Streptomyces sp. NPDC005438]|uniref:ATP-binding SpoIIE family protein phosphatase n=1 Tax=Streptomyces sp. NPDC005438 TaxID=3156880 RepID=UPI0033AF186D
MRTEDVLAAVATGLWRWDNRAGTVTVDSIAAELLGLPGASTPAQGTCRTTTIDEAHLRARLNATDIIKLVSEIHLALAQHSTVESTVRVVNEHDEVVRHVRLRFRPETDPDVGPDFHSLEGANSPFVMVGSVNEVAPRRERVAGDRQEGAGRQDHRSTQDAFLVEAGRVLAEARTPREMLGLLKELEMPGIPTSSQELFHVDGDRLITSTGRDQSGQGEPPDLEIPLWAPYPATEAVRAGRAVYLTDPDSYQREFPETWPIAEQDQCSWAFIPLSASGRTLGVWALSFEEPVAFVPDQRGLLISVARMVGQYLSRASVQESERELASVLRKAMRPAQSPDIPGMEVAARYVPAGGGLQVGGDWFDVIPLPSGRRALVIGDVQGHDVRAAGLMGQLRIALRAYASEGHHPDAVLSRASRFLHGLNAVEPDDDERYATCLYIEADPDSGSLDLARAGHPDPAIRMTDGTMFVRPTSGGLPLGVEPDGDYPTTRLVLEPGETMLLCTDGLIETGGHNFETGWARIGKVLETHLEDSMEQLADALLQAVHGPTAHRLTGPLTDRREDDIALMLLSRNHQAAGPVYASSRRTVLTVAQSEPARIADARHQLRGLLHDWTDPDQVDGAVLMLSEMLTNVLVHTDGDALMVAELGGERGNRRLRVEVADRSDELPHRRQPGELASSGRGLVLLESLADRWGVDPRGEGKCIWFQLTEGSSPPGWD